MMRRIHQKIWGTILPIIALIGILVLSLFLIQPYYYDRSYGTSPDVIVVLGGGTGTRIEFLATNIIHSVSTSTVLVTGGLKSYGVPHVQRMKQYAQSLGIKQPIEVIDHSLSTFDDARLVRAFIAKNKLDVSHIMVVTSDYHTGRSHWVFSKVFPTVMISVKAVPHVLHHGHWWSDYNVAQHVFEEKARFLFYRFVVMLAPDIIKTND